MSASRLKEKRARAACVGAKMDPMKGSAKWYMRSSKAHSDKTNLTNESAAYLTKREELRMAEIELMRQRERVAELRRHLPAGPVLEDYKFIEGPVDLDSERAYADARTVRLSELFTGERAAGDFNI